MALKDGRLDALSSVNLLSGWEVPWLPAPTVLQGWPCPTPPHPALLPPLPLPPHGAHSSGSWLMELVMV